MSWTEPRRRGGMGLLLAAASLFATLAFGREPLPLRLLDAAGAPVAHARVTVVGRTGGVSTDADGIFHLNPEPVPPFDLAVFSEQGSWLGLIRVRQLGQEGTRDLYLPLLEKVEVNVHGGVAPSTPASPASAATVISRTENDQRLPANLLHVLEEVPGSTPVGPGHAAVPSLRGLARGRTLVLIDDARVTTERRAGPSATFLDPFVLENVEVVRGPASVMYGTDALGGVIHARTPVPDPGKFGTRFEVAAGTGEKLASAAFEANIPAGGNGVLVQVHGRDFDNYDSPRGEIPNSAAEDHGYLVKALLPGKKTRWTLGLQSDRARDTGKPGLETVYPIESSDRFTVGADLPPPGGFDSLELRAFLGSYRLVTDREETDPATGNPRRFRSDVEATDASFRLVATRPTGRGFVRAGLDTHGRFDLSSRNLDVLFDDQGDEVSRTEEETIESARQIHAGMFVEGERVFSSGRSSVAAGLRGQYVGTRNSGGDQGSRSESESTFSGYLAYTGRPAEPWLATVQLARGFRAPFLSDRYFSGLTGRGFIEGNPDLEPETSRQIDLSVQRTGQLVRFAAYAYLYRIRDLIERFRQPDGSFAFRNRGEEEIQGLELESDLNLGKALSARLTVNWARGRILDDDSFAADIPPLGAGVSLHHRPVERLWWRVSYSLFARDDEPGEGEAPVSSYGVLDAAAGLALREGLEARLILGNLLDESHPASADDDSVLAPGRSAALVVAGRF